MNTMLRLDELSALTLLKPIKGDYSVLKRASKKFKFLREVFMYARPQVMNTCVKYLIKVYNYKMLIMFLVGEELPNEPNYLYLMSLHNEKTSVYDMLVILLENVDGYTVRILFEELYHCYRSGGGRLNPISNDSTSAQFVKVMRLMDSFIGSKLKLDEKMNTYTDTLLRMIKDQDTNYSKKVTMMEVVYRDGKSDWRLLMAFQKLFPDIFVQYLDQNFSPHDLFQLLCGTNSEDVPFLHYLSEHTDKTTFLFMIQMLKNDMDPNLLNILLGNLDSSGRSFMHVLSEKKKDLSVFEFLRHSRVFFKSNFNRDVLQCVDDENRTILMVLNPVANQDSVISLLNLARVDLGEYSFQQMLKIQSTSGKTFLDELKSFADLSLIEEVTEFIRPREIAAKLTNMLDVDRSIGRQILVDYMRKVYIPEFLEYLLHIFQDRKEQFRELLMSKGKCGTFFHTLCTELPIQKIELLMAFLKETLDDDDFAELILSRDSFGQTSAHLVSALNTDTCLLEFVIGLLDFFEFPFIQNLFTLVDIYNNTVFTLINEKANIETLLSFLEMLQARFSDDYLFHNLLRENIQGNTFLSQCLNFEAQKEKHDLIDYVCDITQFPRHQLMDEDDE